jgi:putative ABC transport system permease protein
MRLQDSFFTAFRGLTSHKTRTVLTMLGIIIGITSVIMMMSLGKGAEGLILGQLNSFGPDSLFIRAGGGSQGGGPPNFGQLQALKYADWQAVSRLSSVTLSSPVLIVDAVLNYQNQSSTPQVTAVSEQYLSLNRVEPERGRDLDKSDIDGAAHVVILGHKVAEELFGDEDPIGKTINVKRKNFEVVGVMPQRGSGLFNDLDQSAFLPITTARKELTGGDHINFMMVRAVGDIDFTAQDIRLMLRDRHRIDNPTGDTKKDDFLVMTQVQAASTFGAVSGALTIFLSAIASISLVVGGIGIMNIMLVSVTERTREIGLRKAVGATRRDILTQFLLEAMMLTTLGGLIGIIGGTSFSFLAAQIIGNYSADWQFAVPPKAIALAFGVASMVGLVFGLYPAQKASKLDPIEALRYE